MVGVSYTEDMTGEFFGTFLIPSIVHQDPHYHRMPHASIPRRILHAAAQVFWTQGDNGKGMLNYADLVGFPIDTKSPTSTSRAERPTCPPPRCHASYRFALGPDR